MTGVDDVDDWSDWDEDGTDGGTEDESSGNVDSESGDTYGETETTGWEGSFDRETESRQEEPAGTENRANVANTEVMNQADTGGGVRARSDTGRKFRFDGYGRIWTDRYHKCRN